MLLQVVSAMTPDRVAQDFIHPGLEKLHGWRPLGNQFQRLTALGGKLDKSQIPSQTKKADTEGSLSHLLWVPYKKLQKLASNYVRKPATGRPTLPTEVDFHQECPASLSPISLLKAKTPLAKKALLPGQQTMQCLWTAKLRCVPEPPWYNVERATRIFLFPKMSSAHRTVF